jgi:DNA-binding NarL/FixJ family response regulator
LIAGAVGASSAKSPKEGTAPEFSGRQLAVLKCLLQGKANKVIARELDIAEGTVKAHLWAIYQALGVNSRAQAMYRVHELRMFDEAPA